MISLKEMLAVLAKHDGSDLYLSTGAPPCAKFQGTLKPISKEVLGPDDAKNLVYELLNEEQIEEFEKEFDIQIPDDQAENIGTVGQAISYIEEAKK